jgi:hypothetical protein
MLIEKLSGLHNEYIAYHGNFSMLFMIPAITVYVLAIQAKKKAMENENFTFKTGLVFGLIMTLFITFLSIPAQIITSELIATDYFENIIAYSVAQNQMTQLEAEAYFNLKSYLSQVVISTPILGIITTLPVAAVIASKKK